MDGGVYITPPSLEIHKVGLAFLCYGKNKKLEAITVDGFSNQTHTDVYLLNQLATKRHELLTSRSLPDSTYIMGHIGTANSRYVPTIEFRNEKGEKVDTQIALQCPSHDFTLSTIDYFMNYALTGELTNHIKVRNYSGSVTFAEQPDQTVLQVTMEQLEIALKERSHMNDASYEKTKFIWIPEGTHKIIISEISIATSLRDERLQELIQKGFEPLHGTLLLFSTDK